MLHRMRYSVRMIAGILLAGLLGILAWNSVGPVKLTELDETYVANFRGELLSGQQLGPKGVDVLRSIVEQQSRPSFDPIRILREQVWYNAVTAGYDLQIWIEPAEYTAGKELYAIYLKDNLLFLRIEYKRRNRVLICALSHDEVLEAIRPFLVEG